MRDNLGDDEKKENRLEKMTKKRKMDKRLQTVDERNSIFNNLKCAAWLNNPYSQHQLSD